MTGVTSPDPGWDRGCPYPEHLSSACVDNGVKRKSELLAAVPTSSLTSLFDLGQLIFLLHALVLPLYKVKVLQELMSGNVLKIFS